MKTLDAAKAFKMVQNGAKIQIRQNASNLPKLKIKYGPFGIFVSRYDIDPHQCQSHEIVPILQNSTRLRAASFGAKCQTDQANRVYSLLAVLR